MTSPKAWARNRVKVQGGSFQKMGNVIWEYLYHPVINIDPENRENSSIFLVESFLSTLHVEASNVNLGDGHRTIQTSGIQATKHPDVQS